MQGKNNEGDEEWYAKQVKYWDVSCLMMTIVFVLEARDVDRWDIGRVWRGS
jgi:hypothetical protein